MIHLHWHSHYSLLEAVGSPERVVEKAKKLWMDAIGITDYHGMYWSVEFFQVAQKNNIKPIIWVELTLTSDINEKNWINNSQNIVLIAANADWYQNLLKIVSCAHIYWFDERPKIDHKNIQKHSKWLIGLMWWINSQIWKMILDNQQDGLIKETISFWKQVFGDDNFFLELVAQNESKIPDIAKVNKKIMDFWKTTDTKITICNDFCYINKSDKKAYEILLCIKDGKQEGQRKVSWAYHIMDSKEIHQVMTKNGYQEEFVQNLINNNKYVADKIDLQIPLGNILFPNYKTAEDIKQLYAKQKDGLICN